MKTWLDFDELAEQHGKDALFLFEAFKKTPPTEPLTREFADYLMSKLPDGFMVFDKVQWGLENEDSDSFLEWCEQCYFTIPSIDASVMVEVGNYHYFVSLDTEDGYSECETVKYQDAVIELLLEWTEQIKEERKND